MWLLWYRPVKCTAIQTYIKVEETAHDKTRKSTRIFDIQSTRLSSVHLQNMWSLLSRGYTTTEIEVAFKRSRDKRSCLSCIPRLQLYSYKQILFYPCIQYSCGTLTSEAYFPLLLSSMSSEYMLSIPEWIIKIVCELTKVRTCLQFFL